MNPFTPNRPPTEVEEQLGSYIDPRLNNQTGYNNGQRVSVTIHAETREGVIVKQVDERHFLVKLDIPFLKVNSGKIWLTVCRDFAHQCIEKMR